MDRANSAVELKPRIRLYRTMHSACVYENTWPMWRAPDTVGGGVSTEYTGAFDEGSKAWQRSVSHSACAAGSIALGSYGAERGEEGSAKACVA